MASLTWLGRTAALEEMPSWISVIVLLLALVGLFFWLPWGYAVAGVVLIGFLIFLELFLAEIRGKHILHQRESRRRDDRGRVMEESPRETTVRALWFGLTADATSLPESSPSHEGLGEGSGFDPGLGGDSFGGGGDA